MKTKKANLSDLEQLKAIIEQKHSHDADLVLAFNNTLKSVQANSIVDDWKKIEPLETKKLKYENGNYSFENRFSYARKNIKNDHVKLNDGTLLHADEFIARNQYMDVKFKFEI